MCDNQHLSKGVLHFPHKHHLLFLVIDFFFYLKKNKTHKPVNHVFSDFKPKIGEGVKRGAANLNDSSPTLIRSLVYSITSSYM